MEHGKLCTDASGALLSKVSPVESCWSAQGKGTSGAPTRPKKPMQCPVADRLVVVQKLL